jgi:hypothetical protein
MKKTYTIIFVLTVLLGVYSIFMYSKNYTQDTPLFAVASSTPTVIPKITPVSTIYTGDWKTCKNEKYGYEFKYPPHWLGGESCNSRVIQLISTSTKLTPWGTLNCAPEVQVTYTSNEKLIYWNNPDRVVDDKYIIDTATHFGNLFNKEYYVDDKRFFVFNVSKDVPCQMYPMSTAHENGILEFLSTNLGDTILEGMLSTFKFRK